MALRNLLGCLTVASALFVAAGCKDKAKTGPAADLEKKCGELAKACGDSDKHVEKVSDECKQVAKTQVENGCADKAIATYDCYEKDVCGNGDKVWALDDLRVLAERHKKCVGERTASADCAKK